MSTSKLPIPSAAGRSSPTVWGAARRSSAIALAFGLPFAVALFQNRSKAGAGSPSPVSPNEVLAGHKAVIMTMLLPVLGARVIEGFSA